MKEVNPQKCVAPDVFVAFRVPNRKHCVYLVWEEGKGLLDVVFEFTSKKNHSEDFGRKMDIYRRILEVREVFIFDPLREYLVPPFVGYYRKEDRWVREEPKGERLISEVLGLEVVMVGEHSTSLIPKLDNSCRLLTNYWGNDEPVSFSVTPTFSQ